MRTRFISPALLVVAATSSVIAADAPQPVPTTPVDGERLTVTGERAINQPQSVSASATRTPTPRLTA